MSIMASRIAGLVAASSVVLLTAMPASALTRADQPVQAWPAMADSDAATLLKEVQDMPLSDMALGDQPYCAADAEIRQTLEHDFAEARVDGNRHPGAELWGSASMGTWTLVAPRADDTSCIIASGIGYKPGRAIEVYYKTAGL